MRTHLRSLRRGLRNVILGIALVSAPGCEQPDDTSVDRGPLPDSDIPSWTLGDEPIATFVGVVDSQGDSLFLDRVGGVAVTESGRIVLSVGADENRVVLVDRGGRLIWHLGGLGEGPGEFQSLTRLLVTPDGVAVWDGVTRRLTVINASGEVVSGRQFSLPPFDLVVGILGTGELVSTPAGKDVKAGEEIHFDVWTNEGTLDRSVAGPVALEDGVVTVSVAVEGQSQPATRGLGVLSPACLPRVLHAVVGGQLIIADGARGEVSRTDGHGRPIRILGGHVARPMTDEMVREARERITFWLEGGVAVPGPAGLRRRPEGAQGAVDSILDLMGGTGTPLRSVWDRVLADGDERFWLRRASCYSDDPSRAWDVFDIDGQWVATVQTSSDLRIRAVGADFVVATFTDEMDVDHISVLPVLKGRTRP